MGDRIKRFFLDSETIFLARLQMFAGVFFATVLATDPQLIVAYVPAKWAAAFLFAWGLLTEYARRRRTGAKADSTPDDEIRGV